MIPPGVGSVVTGASVQHIGASLCLNSDPPPHQSLPLAAILSLRWHHVIHTISISLPNMVRVTLVVLFSRNTLLFKKHYKRYFFHSVLSAFLGCLQLPLSHQLEEHRNYSLIVLLFITSASPSSLA